MVEYEILVFFILLGLPAFLVLLFAIFWLIRGRNHAI